MRAIVDESPTVNSHAEALKREKQPAGQDKRGRTVVKPDPERKGGYHAGGLRGRIVRRLTREAKIAK